MMIEWGSFVFGAVFGIMALISVCTFIDLARS